MVLVTPHVELNDQDSNMAKSNSQRQRQAMKRTGQSYGTKSYSRRLRQLHRFNRKHGTSSL